MSHRIVIVMDAQGRFTIDAQVPNEVVALGMLELAKKLVGQMKQGNAIALPTSVTPGNGR